MSDHAQFHVAVDVFVVRDGKLLLGKRKNTFGAGFWGLPGGHLEQKETIEQAGLRELNEETGLVAKSAEFALVFNNNNREEHYIHFAVAAPGVTGDPKVMEPEKFESWQCFVLAQLPDKETLWVHAPQIVAFKEKRNFIGHS